MMTTMTTTTLGGDVFVVFSRGRLNYRGGGGDTPAAAQVSGIVGSVLLRHALARDGLEAKAYDRVCQLCQRRLTQLEQHGG